MAVLTEKPAAWNSYQRILPTGYRAIKNSEALSDTAILKEARKFIDKNVKANMPLGTKEFKIVNGKQLLFTIEPHYHEPGGPVKPWGWHKGASVSINPNPAPKTPLTKGWSFFSKPATKSGINPYSNPPMTTMRGDVFEGERLDRFKAAVKAFFARKFPKKKNVITP